MKLGVVFLVAAAQSCAAQLKPHELEFFEAKIRPVLVQDCYECHRTGGKMEGGLALDYRGAMEEGGETDDLYDFKNPRESYLIRVIDHLVKDTEMPEEGAKLEKEVIEDFVKWIEMGAPDPRDEPPSDDEVAEEGSWEKVRDRRKEWWSFQPIKGVKPPDGEGTAIDRFVQAKIKEAGLNTVARAKNEVLVRRLSYALRGVPPTPEEVEEFGRDLSWEKLVDHFLSSPQYGERWGRHWMDWLRYADSHGSEGDPAIPNAWRYRDYLIRALNSDVPYDQLVREHLAGDLLEFPRIVNGINESAHGPGHLRMVFHGFTPTDALDELVRFTDDQVNVVSKAFQGLTVSCARCHNHKFDAISQEDYYAWFGIFASTKPGMVRVDMPGDESVMRAEMKALKNQIRKLLAQEWSEANEAEKKLKDLKGDRVEKAERDSFLGVLKWGRSDIEKTISARDAWDASKVKIQWRRNDLLSWTAQGEHVDSLSEAGAFAISSNQDKVIEGIYPKGRYSHLLSDKDRGIFLSPRTKLDGEYELWWELIGAGDAVARYAVQNYPSSGTVYPMTTLKGGQWREVKRNLDYWNGDIIHLELTTGQDQAILTRGGSRSWVGIRQAMLLKKGSPNPPTIVDEMEQLLASRFRADDSIEQLMIRVAKDAAKDWEGGTLTDAQAFLLDGLIREGVLADEGANELAEKYRALETSLATPIRAPGVWEADSFDQPFYVRGDHRKPSEPVRRRFFEAFDPTPYESKLSGRLELADDIASRNNPFTARVLVNRVWHHLFGRGLVGTTDNFGRLGEKPTHPELLDYLAKSFMDDGWSIKELIKELVMSETWQRGSVPLLKASEIDPENHLLSHFRLQRLDAEAIRDSLLMVSGALENEMYGGPVNGNSGRRSVYVRNQRNRLDPFLTTFNAPVPLGGKGRRDLTNVPAQSLALLNSDRIVQLAQRWANQLKDQSRKDAVREMFMVALAREASEQEVEGAIAFMKTMDVRRNDQMTRRKKLQEQLDSLRGAIAAIENAVRDRVESSREIPEKKKGPKAWAFWDFEKDANDQRGNLHGKLHAGAVIEHGALVTGRNGGYVSTKPLGKSLGEKTMQVLLELDGLTQRGGGAITVQTPNGSIFDSIVFGEQQAGHWLAGSNSFVRTQSFTGLKEEARGPVWITTVYQKDGTIQAYRNGIAYGKSYRKAKLITYGNDAVVLFGNRHGAPSAGRLLQAKIHEARLYDRALTLEEVAQSTGSVPGVSEKEMIEAMSKIERMKWKTLKLSLKETSETEETLKQGSGPGSGLGDLAHALFNMKEFIYLR